MLRVKTIIKKLPILGAIATRLWQYRKKLGFRGANAYWEERYATGGNSGAGSYGHLAQFKADALNRFVNEHGIGSVIELGCGDGNQLSLARYPSYIGLDVSATAIAMCQERFRQDGSKSFFLYAPEHFTDNHGIFAADLALSLDVVYHLTEDAEYERYMRQLFKSGTRYVVIYSFNQEGEAAPHVRHRRFTDWIEQHVPHWRLGSVQKNQYLSDSDFYFFERGK